LIGAVNTVKGNSWLNSSQFGETVINYLNQTINGLGAIRAALQTPEEDAASRNGLIGANVSATIQALASAINAVINSAECRSGTPPSTPPGQPPGGTPQTSAEWKVYFDSILDRNTYPTVTQDALQATQGALQAKGAGWQRSGTSTGSASANCVQPGGSNGNLRPRLYVYDSQGIYDPYSIDVGSCFGSWQWHPNY